ncbi:hypothetical protein ACFLZB_03160 [Nanoarchaeota archaeon]
MVCMTYTEEKFYLVGAILNQDSQKSLSIGEYFLRRNPLGDLSAEPGKVMVLSHKVLSTTAMRNICDLTEDGDTFYAPETHIFQQIDGQAQFTSYGEFALHRCLMELIREKVTSPHSQASHQ